MRLLMFLCCLVTLLCSALALQAAESAPTVVCEVKVSNIPAADLLKQLPDRRPKGVEEISAPTGGDVVTVKGTDEIAVRIVEGQIRSLDRQAAQKLVKIVVLQYTTPDDFMYVLNRFRDGETTLAGSLGAFVPPGIGDIVPVDGVGLLVKGRDAESIAQFEQLVALLDRPRARAVFGLKFVRMDIDKAKQFALPWPGFDLDKAVMSGIAEGTITVLNDVSVAVESDKGRLVKLGEGTPFLLLECAGVHPDGSVTSSLSSLTQEAQEHPVPPGSSTGCRIKKGRSLLLVYPQAEETAHDRQVTLLFVAVEDAIPANPAE